MTIARTLGIALRGVSGYVVEVEADLSAGLPGLSFTGLADVSVVEARDRIRAAVLNSGAPWPNRRITVALLPADVRKVGSRFDLAMTVAVLAAAGEVRGQTVNVSGNGTYSTTNTSFIASTEGTWRWESTYSGDSNNQPVTSSCGTERFTIANS